QRVDHVKVVRPGFREVFPRMGARIGRYEALRPVERRALLVMRPERRAVIVPFVAEYAPELVEPARVADQQVPVVVPDLVTEMTEQRAIGLLHDVAHALAFGIVRLRQAEGDETAGVAGHHRL